VRVTLTLITLTLITLTIITLTLFTLILFTLTLITLTLTLSDPCARTDAVWCVGSPWHEWHRRTRRDTRSHHHHPCHHCAFPCPSPMPSPRIPLSSSNRTTDMTTDPCNRRYMLTGAVPDGLEEPPAQSTGTLCGCAPCFGQRPPVDERAVRMDAALEPDALDLLQRMTAKEVRSPALSAHPPLRLTGLV
jgi:hypothetical protein